MSNLASSMPVASTPADQHIPPAAFDPTAPGMTPDGQFTDAGEQAVRTFVDQISAGLKPGDDPARVLATIQENLPRYVGAALARTIGQRDPEPGHYSWCMAGKCITHYHGSSSWTEHLGSEYHTVLEDFSGNGTLTLIAELAQDDDFLGPHTVVHLHTEGGEGGVFLNAPAVDEALRHLEGLVNLLQVLREQMTTGRTEVAA